MHECTWECLETIIYRVSTIYPIPGLTGQKLIPASVKYLSKTCAGSDTIRTRECTKINTELKRSDMALWSVTHSVLIALLVHIKSITKMILVGLWFNDIKLLIYASEFDKESISSTTFTQFVPENRP